MNLKDWLFVILIVLSDGVLTLLAFYIWKIGGELKNLIEVTREYLKRRSFDRNWRKV